MCTYTPCAHTRHVHIHVMCTYMPCAHTRHVHIHAMCIYMPCAHTCHVHMHAMCTYMPCAHTCHVHMHAMCTYMPCAVMMPNAHSPIIPPLMHTHAVYNYYSSKWEKCTCILEHSGVFAHALNTKMGRYINNNNIIILDSSSKVL